MPYSEYLGNDEINAHLAEHDLTPNDFEDVVNDPETIGMNTTIGEPGDINPRTAVTRPILEAFFHARDFLEMVCKYGRELHAPPDATERLGQRGLPLQSALIGDRTGAAKHNFDDDGMDRFLQRDHVRPNGGLRQAAALQGDNGDV